MITAGAHFHSGAHYHSLMLLGAHRAATLLLLLAVLAIAATIVTGWARRAPR